VFVRGSGYHYGAQWVSQHQPGEIPGGSPTSVGFAFLLEKSFEKALFSLSAAGENFAILYP